MRDELLNNLSNLRVTSLPLMGAKAKQVAPPQSPERKPETPGNISSQQKYVLLVEWWLMKASKEYDGRRLAVGGFTRRRDTMRIFNSVPIVKRHDHLTLETANGIILKIEGSLNKIRTIGNEFPLEACSIFLFGFPAAWEFFAYKYNVNQASHQLIQEPKPGDTFDSPLQPQTVILRDWWLSKNDKGDEGYQLSVGGLTKWLAHFLIFFCFL
ncbi:hypothetical protein HPP92_001535 [Vanilla planifolia]|uniref:SANTA domain-containing protein n=1 Tax=Vanilla planifolia TaxID=51239 RepID=A0A835S2P7_VANPL|nr:hypothetical protein HPP92_001535 [Vanilla planifolia]